MPFDYLGTSLLAFALGASVWKPWNYFFCEQKVAIDKVIEEDKIPFELLLKKAQDQTKTVSVSMANGKVYVGWVTHLLNPALPTNYIQLLPVKSGYRDEETKWVVFTTFYSEALDKLERGVAEKYDEYVIASEEMERLEAENKEKNGDKQADHLLELRNRIEALEIQIVDMEATADDFDIVLPVSEIMSINIFSEYVHSEHFAPPKENGEPDASQVDEAALDLAEEERTARRIEEEKRFAKMSEAERKEHLEKLMEEARDSVTIPIKNLDPPSS